MDCDAHGGAGGWPGAGCVGACSFIGGGGGAVGADGGGSAAPRASVARWVPYRHTNGVAIYRHPEEGEYMASSIVKVC